MHPVFDAADAAGWQERFHVVDGWRGWCFLECVLYCTIILSSLRFIPFPAADALVAAGLTLERRWRAMIEPI